MPDKKTTRTKEQYEGILIKANKTLALDYEKERKRTFRDIILVGILGKPLSTSLFKI